MKNITKFFFIVVGFITLGIGAIGIVLPGLPTTPFFLLTCFCFAKGSTRFNHWFINTNLYKNHMEEFVRTRGMTLKKKLRICAAASVFMAISLILVPLWHVRVIIVCAMIFMWGYFTFRIKTLE